MNRTTSRITQRRVEALAQRIKTALEGGAPDYNTLAALSSSDIHALCRYHGLMLKVNREDAIIDLLEGPYSFTVTRGGSK
jgi:hypothetical protein